MATLLPLPAPTTGYTTESGTPSTTFFSWLQTLRSNVVENTTSFDGIVTPVTVANLPVSAPAGSRGFVTNATVTTFASIVAGGGGNYVPVYKDNAGNWRIG